ELRRDVLDCRDQVDVVLGGGDGWQEDVEEAVARLDDERGADGERFPVARPVSSPVPTGLRVRLPPRLDVGQWPLRRGGIAGEHRREIAGREPRAQAEG